MASESAWAAVLSFLQLVDLLFNELVVVLRFFVLRLKLESLVVMLERIRPIGQLFLIAFLTFTALIKRVAQIVMTAALQTGIF